MLARDIMSPQLVSCSPEATLREAAILMVDNDCGLIPVVEDRSGKITPIGVVTDRDITCRAVAEGLDPSATNVEECMSTPVFCVDQDTPVEECVQQLAEHHVRRLVVLDRKGACCGLIAQADVARSVPREETGRLVREVSMPAGHPGPDDG